MRKDMESLAEKMRDLKRGLREVAREAGSAAQRAAAGQEPANIKVARRTNVQVRVNTGSSDTEEYASASQYAPIVQVQEHD